MKRRNGKWTGCICLVLVLAMAAGGIFVYMHNEKIKQNAYAVMVKTPYFSGQGVVYEKTDVGTFILTAGHVTEGMKAGDVCKVLFFGGQEAEAELYYVSETADAAFLYVTDEKVPDGIVAVQKDRQKFDALAEGDALYAVDFDGTRIEKTEGTLLSPWIYLEDFSLDMMLVRLSCQNGMSGCGIVDRKGSLVGILCGRAHV